MMIYILLIAHFLADFTFQPAKLAKGKIKDFRFLLTHSLIYAGVFLAAVFPFVKLKRAVLPYLIIVISHFLIDWIRITLDRKYANRTYAFTSFMIDQILHTLIIAVIYFIFDISTQTNQLYEYVKNRAGFGQLIIYFLIFIIIWDPAAAFIKKLFLYIGKNGSSGDDGEPQAGRMIGKLERVIISVLVLYNQMGAIGFVLTAKSIARYKQLEDKNFAEKYLVGTLASAAIALITTILLKRFL